MPCGGYRRYSLSLSNAPKTQLVPFRDPTRQSFLHLLPDFHSTNPIGNRQLLHTDEIVSMPQERLASDVLEKSPRLSLLLPAPIDSPFPGEVEPFRSA